MEIDSNKVYLIKDNGLRCFMPPCFSWDIIDLNGELVGTVSDIDLSRVSIEIDKSRVQKKLYSLGLKVKGYTKVLKVFDGNRQGIAFIVLAIINTN